MTDLEQQYSAYRREACVWCGGGWPLAHKCTALPILEWADQQLNAKDQRIAELETGILNAHAILPKGWVYYGSQETLDLLVAEISTQRQELKAKGEEIERLREALEVATR